MSIAAEALALAQAQTAPSSGPTGEADAPQPDGGQVDLDGRGADRDAEPSPASPETGSTKKLSWDQEVAKLPPELQSLAKGLQGMVTRKTQQLADERKALAAEREAWRKSISKLASSGTPDGELPEIDQWDPASIQARIEAEVSRRLADALGPVESEYRAAQADMEFDRFVSAHPDLMEDPEIKSGVAELLKKNESIDLETAYYAVRGRLAKSSGSKQSSSSSGPATDPRRAAVKKAAEAVAAPRRPPVSAPFSMSPADLKKATPEQILALARSRAERR